MVEETEAEKVTEEEKEKPVKVPTQPTEIVTFWTLVIYVFFCSSYKPQVNRLE